MSSVVHFPRSLRTYLVLLGAWILLLMTCVKSYAAVSFSEFNVPTANSIPFGITAGPDETIWFTEYQANKIGRLASGLFSEYKIPTAKSGPISIAVGPDSALWFTEVAAGKIGRITIGGTISEFALTSNSAPYAIVSAGGALWYTESARSKIGRITAAGVSTEFDIPTAKSQPQGIALGSDGALWFVERATNKIGRMTTGGTFNEYAIPTPDSNAIEITAGPDNALWFTESAANKIGRIATSGAITEYSISIANSNPIDIIAGPGGALWFTANGANKIAQITTAGVVTTDAIPTPSSAPIGIAVLSGNVWFTESAGNKIGVQVLGSAPSAANKTGVRAPNALGTYFFPFVRIGPIAPCVVVGTYDDIDPHIVYTSGWQFTSATGAYNNTLHYSDTVGDSVQLSFCGGGVTLLYAANYNVGVLRVLIDGVSVATIDGYSATLQWQKQWVSNALPNGIHVLTLTHVSGGTGPRVNVDAIQVNPASTQQSSICVSVYYDMNGNQNRDAGEPLLRGAQVTLETLSDMVIGSFVSYDTAVRCFTDLPEGNYKVVEGPHTKTFTSTTPDTQVVTLPGGTIANVYFGDSVSQPNGLVSDTSRGHLYVTSRDTGWLLAWDEIDNKILMTLDMGTHPQGVGLVNDRVFVSVEGSKVVQVVDAATQIVLDEINTASICDGDPTTVAVHPTANKVYVAMRGSPGHVAVIDAVSLDVQCIDLPNPTGNGATGVAVNPSLNQLYVTSRDGKSLLVYDTNTNTLIQPAVPLTGQGYFVQAKPSTNQVYVTVASDSPNYVNASTLQLYYATAAGVTLPLTTTNTISNTEPGGTIWVSRANGNLYVAASHDNRVQIINPVTLAILQTIVMTETNSLPFAITENNALNTIYVGKRNVNLILKLSNNLP